jgi:hypothetical protein
VAPRPKSSASQSVRSILKIKVSGIRYAITDLNVRTDPTAGLSVEAVRLNAIRDYRAVCRRHPQVKSLSDARIGRGHHNLQGPGPALDYMISDFTVGWKTPRWPDHGYISPYGNRGTA